MEEKEKRIRALTKLYYSNPSVQDALFRFSAGREIVPRYYEGFGKRPDNIQYPSDIMGWVNKGATSLHVSEEIWHDPLRLSSEMTQEEVHLLRKGWDLLIDIDSPYLDLSRIAAQLVVNKIETFGIRSYGIKFSGSKGFHIIVSYNAFPTEFYGKETKNMFPEFPRAITEYLFHLIRKEFNLEVGKIMSFNKVEKSRELIDCLQCNKPAQEGVVIRFRCPVCNLIIERKDSKITKRRLRCLRNNCAGVLEALEEKKYYYCEQCDDPDNEKMQLNSLKYPELFEKIRGEDAGSYGKLDLVLVAPRHLFRMPYSLHEKTALSSVVLKKEQLNTFSPRDADPLKVKILDFYPSNNPEEAKLLLAAALEWKISQERTEEKREKKGTEHYEELKIQGVSEEFFPPSIKKLLQGLHDGKKRGLFVLVTFLKSLNFPREYIEKKVREWNVLNIPPLKEGYIKSQLDWHFKQKRKILPPNYEHESFYRDLGLIEKKPDVKNPIVEVLRALRKLRTHLSAPQ